MSDKNFPADIQVLKGPEAVRQRVDMYFGACIQEETLDRLPIELMCHAIDEVIDGNCNSIKIIVHSTYFEVHYDAGIPLTIIKHTNETYAEHIMSHLFACKNLKKHLEVGDHMCNLGLATVNFGAEWCDLITVSQNQKGHFKFREGGLESKNIQSSKKGEQTVIKLKPDKSLFGNLWFTYGGVAQKAQRLSKQLTGFNIEVESG